MKILFASAESAPFFKTGGLGDVTYALPKELAKQEGVDVRVVLPYYQQMPASFRDQVQEIAHFSFKLGWRQAYCGIKHLYLDQVHYYFIDNQSYFYRQSLYGEWDDGERFAFFSTAIIEMLEVIDWIPDILHVNDWQTAMVPALLVDRYHWKQSLRNIRKVLTIHNIRFQGVYDPSMLSEVFGTGYNLFTEDGVRFGNQMNYLKGGINFSDRVTTVSPTYAQEIQTEAFGEGLAGTLRHNQWKLRGIVNGIDTQLNDPQTDPAIAAHFSSQDLRGKRTNKQALQARLGLPDREDLPILAMVSRLTDQKGCQLLEPILHRLLNQPLQVVILGTGEARFEHAFRHFEAHYPDRMRACIQFDVDLAQQIYAGSDLFLMPSAFEPCGLSQMVAMRYGTLPIVHETGGLKDTVQPFNQYSHEGTGFTFYQYDAVTLFDTIQRALAVYQDHPSVWRKLQVQAMSQDFSWHGPCQEYLTLYRELLSE